MDEIWASIFKAETLEELEQLAGKEEVFENMVLTLKKLSEAVFHKENLQVLPMYQDIVSTALRTEKPTQVKKHRTLSCVV